MAKYISTVQLKGGVGKTTILANLCGYLLEQGYSVLTIDADMQQGTLTAWSTLFVQNHNPEKYEHASAYTMPELLSILENAESEFDFILTDAPPRIADIMKALVLVSDLVLVPLNVTSPEIWATEDTKKLIDTALSQKPDLNVKLVFNKIKDKSSTYKTRNKVIEQLDVPYISQSLFEYDTYATVIGKGTHVSAYYIKRPKEQFKAFAKEILNSIKD
jgi:chromosome partitioning protein